MERRCVTKSGESKVDVKSQGSPRPFASLSLPSSPLHQLPHALGNRAFGRCIQAKLKVSQPGDAYEQEADRVADQVMRMPDAAHLEGHSPLEHSAAPARLQRLCSKCEEDDEEKGIQRQAADESDESDELKLQSKSRAGPPVKDTSSIAAQINHLSNSGELLPESTRAYFEPRFGQDFSHVRVHQDRQAAESARSVSALAYTVGRDIVFGEGQYAPQTEHGQRLLAHELAHTLQQKAMGEPVIMREDDPASRFHLDPILPLFSVPGTGLTFQPGPLTATLPGTRLPFPSSLRVTNAFSLTGLGSPSIPSFVLDINPDLFMATLLQRIDLTTSPRAGTPLGREGEEAYQSHISFVNPRLSFNPRTGQILGRAILSVPTGYPPSIGATTEFPLEFHSSDLGQIAGQLSYGPLRLDFTLQLHYDTVRLEEAVRPVFAPEGGFAGFWERFQSILRATVPGARLNSVANSLRSLLHSIVDGTLDAEEFTARTLELIAQSIPAGVSTEKLRTALTQLANEITHPGFSTSGRLRLGPLPLSTFSVEAPTTVPLSVPLYGAPTPFPMTYSAGGVVLAPPGSITDIAVPALGYSRSSFGATSGTSITAALLPTLSPSAISAGLSSIRKFPVYAYAEVAHVRRITAGLDLGVRATLQISTPDLAGPLPQSTDSAERFRQAHQDYLEATSSETQRPPVPNVGLSVFGRFDLF